MCELNTKIIIVQLLRLTIVSAKSKIHSPSGGYLSPGNSVVLELEAAFCRFWGSFFENQERFQQTCLFFHAQRAYYSL